MKNTGRSFFDNSRTYFFGIFVILFLGLTFSASAQESSLMRNFIRHEDGSVCDHMVPDAAFMTYLNDDLSHILIENAPRWELGTDPNIDGGGTYCVELGNFTSPALQTGDVVTTHFFCMVTGQYSAFSDTVTMIPWLRFPLFHYIEPQTFPDRPENVTLTLDASNVRTITWDSEPGVTYSVYRADKDDTVAFGQARKMYELVQDGITGGTYQDNTAGTGAYGYIIVPKSGAMFGPHSEEVVDYPLPPESVAAATAYSSPYKVGISWLMPPGLTDLTFRIYRDTTENVQIVSPNLIGTSDEFSFLDENVNLGVTYYYRIVAVNIGGISSLPSEPARVTVETRYEGTADLNILFIGRTPRYKRYDIAYSPGGFNPHPRQGTENDKHYPDDGEMMTYTANIKNTGGGSVDSIKVEWYVDSVLQKTEYYGHLYPEQRLLSSLQLPWSSDDPAYIRCSVEPVSGETELTVLNNTMENRTNALSFFFYIEDHLIPWYNDYKNVRNSYGFEDWIQIAIDQMMIFFHQAQFPAFAPNGVDERLFIDTIIYVRDGVLGGGTHAPQNWQADGQWGFNGDWEWFQVAVIGYHNLGFEPALIHELSHQLGLIDNYTMDVHAPQMKVIEPRTGETPDLTPVAFGVVLYYTKRNHCTMHSPGANKYSDFTTIGILKDIGVRRGWYGRYLFDLPAENGFLLTKPDGTPLRNYEVWVYQKDGTTNDFPNVTKFRGFTDSTGVFMFPHTTHQSYEGGIQADNPFSSVHSQKPHVVGINSTLFLRTAKGDSVGYSFTDITDFVVAYWSGDSAEAIVPHTIEQWSIIPANDVEDDETGALPKEYELKGNYPNPFNPSTTIAYALPYESSVRLTIYDITGAEVKNYTFDAQSAGYHKLQWNGRNSSNDSVPSGVYLYELVASSNQSNTGTFKESAKMLLLK